MRRAGVTDDEIAHIGNHEAVVDFWVRPEGVALDLDRRLLAALVPWVRDDFAFARVVFGTWDADERQVQIFREAGLRLVWSHPERDTMILHFAG